MSLSPAFVDAITAEIERVAASKGTGDAQMREVAAQVLKERTAEMEAALRAHVEKVMVATFNERVPCKAQIRALAEAALDERVAKLNAQMLSDHTERSKATARTRAEIQKRMDQMAQDMRAVADAVFTERAAVDRASFKAHMDQSTQQMRDVAEAVFAERSAAAVQAFLERKVEETCERVSGALRDVFLTHLDRVDEKFNRSMDRAAESMFDARAEALRTQLREETYALISQDAKRPRRAAAAAQPEEEQEEPEPPKRTRHEFTPHEMALLQCLRDSAGSFDVDVFQRVRATAQPGFAASVTARGVAEWLEKRGDDAAFMASFAAKCDRPLDEVAQGRDWLVECLHAPRAPTYHEIAAVFAVFHGYAKTAFPAHAHAFPAPRSHHSIYNLGAKMEKITQKQFEATFVQ